MAHIGQLGLEGCNISGIIICTYSVQQHNFNAQGLASPVCVTNKQPSSESEISFAQIQQWRSVNVEIGLLHLLWLKLSITYLASC
jgi:hypothetical protein